MQCCQHDCSVGNPSFLWVLSSSFSLATRLCAKYIIQVSSYVPEMAYHDLPLLTKLSQRPRALKRLAWAGQRRVEGCLDSSAFAIVENTDNLERNKLFCDLSIWDGWPSDDSALRWERREHLWACCIRKIYSVMTHLGALSFVWSSWWRLLDSLIDTEFQRILFLLAIVSL